MSRSHEPSRSTNGDIESTPEAEGGASRTAGSSAAYRAEREADPESREYGDSSKSSAQEQDQAAELGRVLGLLESEREARRELAKRVVIVQEEERRRIARELHDHMGQHIAGLILNLKLLKSAISRGVSSAALLEELERVEKASVLVSQEAHRIAVELRSAALDDFGLAATLSNYVEDWSKRYNVEADLQCSGFDNERLPREIETVFYRIVLEALTNVSKHASANRVNVVISRFREYVSLVVEDDGQGFDPEAEFEAAALETAQRRFGLLSMKERATLIGGTLEVESSTGRGAAVFARVPYPKPKSSASRGGSAS